MPAISTFGESKQFRIQGFESWPKSIYSQSKHNPRCFSLPAFQTHSAKNFFPSLATNRRRETTLKLCQKMVKHNTPSMSQAVQKNGDKLHISCLTKCWRTTPKLCHKMVAINTHAGSQNGDAKNLKAEMLCTNSPGKWQPTFSCDRMNLRIWCSFVTIKHLWILFYVLWYVNKQARPSTCTCYLRFIKITKK